MKTALSLLLIVVTSLQIVAQVERSGSPPEVAGYRLGADWQTIGRLMPCRSGPDGLLPGEENFANQRYPQLLAELRMCEPSDSVTLHFFRDTLLRISVRFSNSLPRVSPNATWTQHRDWAVETLGMPDSVVARYDERYEWVTAYWDHTRFQWRAVLWNSAGSSHLDLADCELLPVVCEAIGSLLFW